MILTVNEGIHQLAIQAAHDVGRVRHIGNLIVGNAVAVHVVIAEVDEHVPELLNGGQLLQSRVFQIRLQPREIHLAAAGSQGVVDRCHCPTQRIDVAVRRGQIHLVLLLGDRVRDELGQPLVEQGHVVLDVLVERNDAAKLRVLLQLHKVELVAGNDHIRQIAAVEHGQLDLLLVFARIRRKLHEVEIAVQLLLEVAGHGVGFPVLDDQYVGNRDGQRDLLFRDGRDGEEREHERKTDQPYERAFHGYILLLFIMNKGHPASHENRFIRSTAFRAQAPKPALRNLCVSDSITTCPPRGLRGRYPACAYRRSSAFPSLPC